MTQTEQLAIYRKLFKVRPDAYGVSYLSAGTDDWTGTSIKGALGVEQFKAHLGGKAIVNVANKTTIARFPQMLGGYVADFRDNCNVGVVDVDQDIIEMVDKYVHESGKLGIPVYVEKSKKKGYHLWHFFEEETPAYKVRHILLNIAKLAKLPETEIFPKQDFASKTGKGLGNYINLPLQGTLAKEGKTVFLDQDDIWKPYANQWDFLTTIKYVPADIITAIPEKATPESTPHETTPSEAKDRTPCVELLTTGAEEGNRRLHMTRITGTLGKLLPKDIFTAVVRNWNLLYNKPPLTEAQLLKNVDDNWSCYGAYKEEETELGSLGELIRSHPELSELYVQSVLSLKDARINTSIPDMDKPMRGLCGGEILTILGRPHSGKTALAQSIMYHVWEKQGIPSLMFSLEMTAVQLYERAVAMLLGIDGADVESAARNGGQEWEDLRRRGGGFDGVRYLDIAGLSVEQMERGILEAELKPKLVVIDYLSIIGNKGKDEREQVSNAVKAVQAMAKRTDVAVILLSQVSRTAGDEYTEITIKDGYGTSAIEQDSYFIWALWKDMENPRQRHIKLLKNKRGDAGQLCTMGFVNPSPRLFPIDVERPQGAKFNTTGLEEKEYAF